MKFLVTFKYQSFYESESENKIVEDTIEYKANNLDELFINLDEEDYNDDVVINFNAKSNLNATERDYIKIVDEKNNVVYEDK